MLNGVTESAGRHQGIGPTTERCRGRCCLLTDRTAELENMLTPPQVCERLGISKTYLYRMMQAGELRSVRVGRLRRIRPSDLEAYIASRTEGRDG